MALWDKILEDLHYPDVNLVLDIIKGLPLSGWMSASNVFPNNVFPNGVMPLTLALSDLKGSLELFNQKVKGKQMSVRQDEQLKKDTWEDTMKEMVKGWVWHDTSQSWDGKCMARRFGIHQGGKTRVIDDRSVCGWNQTVGLSEKFVLQMLIKCAPLGAGACEELVLAIIRR